VSRLFGTDGIRGIANTEITAELAYQLGRAATFYFGKATKRPQIIIGRDTRLSGMMLESAMAAGICSAGGDALILGVAPTPAIAYLTQLLKAQAGVVISASHNPYPDNGIKFFSAEGYKLPDAVEDELEEILKNGVENLPNPVGGEVGAIIPIQEKVADYCDYLIGSTSVSLEGLKVVVDCANGAAYEVAPRVYQALGAEVVAMYTAPNGVNINENCGSTHMEALRREVVAQNADIGIAHDGDADRCLGVTETGEMIDGDRMMLICGLLLKAQGRLVKDTVVATVMSNIGFHQAAKEQGLNLEITGVGDRYVLERMTEKELSLGGEQSGHIIFGDLSTTGDGVLSGVQLLSALKNSGKKMSELSSVMTEFPQLLVNIRVKSKVGWEEDARIAQAIQNAEAELGNQGRILVRPSGTEPLLRVMAEGPTMEVLERLTQEIAEAVKSALGAFDEA
jgi:phosphoglucosamine mutase